MTTLQQDVKSFDKRWKNPYDENVEFEKFKRRVLLSFDEHLGDILSNNWLGIKYISLLALPPAPPTKSEHLARYEVKARKNGGHKAEIAIPFAPQKVQFHSTEIWNYISNISDLRELIRCVQYVFWLWHFVSSDGLEKWEDDFVKPFFKSIKDSIAVSQISVRVKGSSGNLRDVVFYPKGAKLLDDKLVDDILDWLPEYPRKSRLYFESALSEFLYKRYRDSIDKMRLSFEAFLMHSLNNRKALEKQKSFLGTYLKDKGVSADIRNTYSTILDQYTKYQNSVAKHPTELPEPTEDEAEFIIYETGVLMRFLIQLDSRHS